MLQGDATRAGATGDCEEILCRDSRGFNHDGAAGGTIGDHDLLGTTHQLAVDHIVRDAEVVGLQTTAVGEGSEVCGVALLEDQWGGLVGVGRSRQRLVGRGVIDPSHREGNHGDLANLTSDLKGAAAAGHLMANTILMIVDGAALKAAAHGCIGRTSACNERFAQATATKHRPIGWSSASSTGTSQLDLKAHLHMGLT